MFRNINNIRKVYNTTKVTNIMPKKDESFALDYCDIFLINDIWESFYNKKEYDSLTGAKNFYGINKEELNKHYNSNISRYWTAKVNTIAKKLKRLSEKKLIIEKPTNGKKKKNIYYPNPKRASLRKFRIPDRKTHRYLVCLDSKDKYLILEF